MRDASRGVLLLVMAHLLAVLGAGANDALRVTETVRPRLQHSSGWTSHRRGKHHVANAPEHVVL